MRSLCRFAFALPLLVCLLVGCSQDGPRPKVMEAHAAAAQPHLAQSPLLTAAQIRSMADNGDSQGIRLHGWEILARMVSPVEVTQQQAGEGNSRFLAAWDKEKWENKCSVGLGGDSPACPKVYAEDDESSCPVPFDKNGTDYPALETAVQQLHPAILFSTPGHPLIPPPNKKTSHGPFAFLSSVRYNPPAAQFIRGNCLFLRKRIENLGNAPVNPSAVIVKLEWAVPDPVTGEMNVWNPRLPQTAEGGTVMPARWSKIKVDFGSKEPCNAGYRTYSSGDAPAGATVPLNCFYHRQYPCGYTRYLGGAAFGFTFDCPKPTDTSFEAILVGVHIITAEQPDWVWATYYWTPNPHLDPYMDGQTDEVKRRGPWQFYAMRITVDSKTPLDKGEKTHHVAFNPYIETFNAHYTQSNCMYCHRLAVMRDKNSGISAGEELLAGSPPPAAYDPSKPYPPGLMRVGRTYYYGAYRTHLLWSVAGNMDEGLRRNSHPLMRTSR